MLIEIRIYRRHDADLMMLKAYGVNIPKFINEVLVNYVDGKRIKYRLPNAMPCSVADVSMLRCRVKVTDQRVITLIHNIKDGYRNQFCKMLLRDAMDSEALGVYLSKQIDITQEDTRIRQPVHETQPIKIRKKAADNWKQVRDRYIKKATVSGDEQLAMKENEDDISPAASKPADDIPQAPTESGDDERFVSFDDDFSPPVSIPEQINPDDEYPSEDNGDTLFETLFSEVNGDR